MTLDIIILILFLAICCILCYFGYAIAQFLKRINANLEKFSAQFSETISRITRIEDKQLETDEKINSLFKELRG
jgi:TRAP-type C4-dicarboxylate transport system permease small subunit